MEVEAARSTAPCMRTLPTHELARSTPLMSSTLPTDELGPSSHSQVEAEVSIALSHVDLSIDSDVAWASGTLARVRTGTPNHEPLMCPS